MSEQLSHVVAELIAGRDVHLTAEDAEALWREVFEVEMSCRSGADVGEPWENEAMTDTEIDIRPDADGYVWITSDKPATFTITAHHPDGALTLLTVKQPIEPDNVVAFPLEEYVPGCRWTAEVSDPSVTFRC